MVPYARAVPVLDLVTLPVRLSSAAIDTTLTLGRLVSQDGPVRRPQGYAERMMAVIGEGGLLERIAAVVTDPVGPRRLVDTVADGLEPGGSLDRLLAPGGTLDQLVALGETLERIQPRLDTLARLVPELHASVTALNEVVEPLSQLAGRIPGARRKAPVDG